MRRHVLIITLIAALLGSAHARDIVTLPGLVYKDAVITRVESAGISISFRGGTAFINFADLPPEVRAEFAQAELDADSVAPSPESARAGELTTIDGKVYRNVTVTRIERTGIRISHLDGIGFVDFVNLPTAARQRYGYSEAAYKAGRGAKQQRDFAVADTQRRTLADAAAREAAAQRQQAEARAAASAAVQRMQAAQPPSSSSIATRDYSATDYSTRGYGTDRYSGGGYTGGTVNVSGYTRKDGTYVHSYTRRK
jgi:hypothetical protein